ncbi:MAG: hypothetical protein ACYCRD_10900 [Leptospirillum sp.]
MGVSKKQQKAVERISEILGEESVVLIGAHALSAWGVPRATRDIDFAASGGPKEIASRLAESGVWAEVHRGDPDDPIPWSVRGVIDGVPFDILPPLEGLSVLDGISVESHGFKTRVCRIKDLVRLKFYAGGPKDILDVAGLATVRPEILSYAREQADKYGVRKTFEAFLEDIARRERRKPENRSEGTVFSKKKEND